MMLRRAVAFAQADDQHLGDAALDLAAEIGVRLDARYGHDGVRLPGVLVPVDRLAPAVRAELDGDHVGLDGDAQGFFADAVLPQQFALTFGRAAAVAAHGGDDERLGAGLAQHIQRRADHRLQIGDASAADGNRDAIARLHLLEQAGAEPATANLAGDIGQGRRGHDLTKRGKRGNFHERLSRRRMQGW